MINDNIDTEHEDTKEDPRMVPETESGEDYSEYTEPVSENESNNVNVQSIVNMSTYAEFEVDGAKFKIQTPDFDLTEIFNEALNFVYNFKRITPTTENINSRSFV